MKKLLVILTIIFTLGGCAYPVLESNEYTVIDTLETSRNGFGVILGYDVIVQKRCDSLLYFGYINTDGELTSLGYRPIKF